MLDLQRLGAELRMGREVSAELVEHRIAQPRQRHMRRITSPLGFEPEADQRLLDLVAQLRERRVALDTDPQRVRLVAAEHTGAGQLEREPARFQPRQRLVDIAGQPLVDLTDKSQGQVQITGIDPLRAADAGAQQRQPQLQLWRKLNPDKEAEHFPPLITVTPGRREAANPEPKNTDRCAWMPGSRRWRAPE